MRPKIALIENVALLRSRGLGQVLYDLKSIGYHAEWDIIPAAAVGAPHLRERIWIIARPAEIAHDPVYGEPTGDPFGFVGKLPRAGRMSEKCEELVPIAPRKTKRKDGWTYWVGVNLFAGTSAPRLLWPSSSSSRDFKDVGDLNCVPDRGLLPRRVFHVEQGTTVIPLESARVPTPCSNDDNKSPEAHMLMKRTKMGSPRNTITSLSVLARNGFRQAGGNLWPTPSAAAAAQGPGNSGREGGENLVTRVNQTSRGSLNPTWVSWLMGIPLWWTDPDWPTEFTTFVPWTQEPLHVAPRVANKIPYRQDQLRALGNAVVWPCAYFALARALEATPVASSQALLLAA